MKFGSIRNTAVKYMYFGIISLAFTDIMLFYGAKSLKSFYDQYLKSRMIYTSCESVQGNGVKFKNRFRLVVGMF